MVDIGEGSGISQSHDVWHKGVAEHQIKKALQSDSTELNNPTRG